MQLPTQNSILCSSLTLAHELLGSIGATCLRLKQYLLSRTGMGAIPY